jgi:lipoprotein-anchoring transpeptidase ErfK/SrfK
MMAKFFVYVSIVIAAIFMLVTGAKAEEVTIVVDISDQTMHVETPTDYFEWDVSTGRKGFSTPRGIYQPYYLTKMHYSSKYNNAPMPHSIFFHGGYAIHATDAINKLGRPASHGCIRLHPRNARWLFRLVKDYGADNTTIYIQN